MRATVASARGSWATAALGQHMQAVTDLEQFSSNSLADDQHRAARVAQLQYFATDLRRRAHVHAPGGWLTMSSLGAASISRPTMNFCRLPPDSDCAMAHLAHRP